jgi:hypothetical protein
VAGIGSVGGYHYFLTRVDVDDSIAVTVGVLAVALTLLADVVGGVIFMASGARLPRLRAKPADVPAA